MCYANALRKVNKRLVKQKKENTNKNEKLS